MITGKMNHIKHSIKIIILLTFFFVNLASASAENKIEFPELLNLFASIEQRTVDFNEEKYAFYLDEPIKTSGYLQFKAPDKLSKHISKPEKISQEINGNILTIINSTETHTVNLEDHPEFSVILQSIINLLSGNHSALQKDFKINFNKQLTDWTLVLTPRNSFVAGQVESIQMNGNTNKLSKIIVTEANKDRSITHIYNHR